MIPRHPVAIFLGLALLPWAARGDCTLTDVGITPLPDRAFQTYKGFAGGLYPDFSNQPPPAHFAAGVDIAEHEIQPRDASGQVDAANGVIVLLSLGMSNTTQEWATRGPETFLALATKDPSLNPRLRIVDGAFGGQDAPDWTDLNADIWSMTRTQRLDRAGVTPNQVQVLWIKQALAGPLNNFGAFPLHAQALQGMLATIVRNAKVHYPNLRLVYLSCRTRAYTDVPNALNPEPAAFETGFADKWVIEDQILGRNNLNFDPAQGAVAAPWLGWGPYLWADGTTPRSDGFTWLCSDTAVDFTHPSGDGGVPKVARQLLAFFKTAPTATPWFLKKTITGQPPGCAISATVTSGVAPLTVDFSATATDADGTIRDYQWTFDDGTFATSANPTKIFKTPGVYTARVTVTDNDGNAVTRSLAVTVAPVLTELFAGAAFSPPAWRTIQHPNGNRYTQVLLTGPAATVTADPGKITRLSYVDLQDDIVQLEFAGEGTMTVTLANPSGPALPVNYNQDVLYMKGHASVLIQGAGPTTFVSAFAVGTRTALNPSLFRDGVDYDGHADLARLVIQSPTGQFGGILLGNVAFADTTGVTGIFAPGVAVTGDIRFHDLRAFEAAEPVLVFGATANAENGLRVTGGDLSQANDRAIRLSGVNRVLMSAGTDAHDRAEPAQTNQARFERDGVDVTALVVVPAAAGP